jgi:beta-lactamase class A
VAQRSSIRSFLSVVSSNQEVGQLSGKFSAQASSRQSSEKTIQFPDLGPTKRSPQSSGKGSVRIPKSSPVSLPPMIASPVSDRVRPNLFRDPRLDSLPLNQNRSPKPPQGSVTLPSSRTNTRQDLSDSAPELRSSPRMSSRQSRSGDARPTRSKSPQSQPVRERFRPGDPERESPQKSRQPTDSGQRKPRKTKPRGEMPPARFANARLSALLSGVRLLIAGVGLAAIAGTLLSIRNPEAQKVAGLSASGDAVATDSPNSGNSGNLRVNSLNALHLGQEIVQLKNEIQTLSASYSQLTPGVFFVDLDTGAYMNLNGNNTFAAASTIKVPILIALFQEVDAGKIRLDEPLTMQAEYVAEGSGDMQDQPVGTQYTVLETARKMITISDNTATNMLIARLGGQNVLNQRFQSWGLSSTQIQNFLPDIQGTNTTSPKDLVYLMAMVEKGGLLSLRSRDRVLDIMQATENNSLLPQGLGNDATIAHKTGNIGSVLADTGIVDMPNGKRYLASVIVKRPHEDPTAQELIRQISQAAYQSFGGKSGIAQNPDRP